MDKGKAKPPSGAIREGGHSQQQVGDGDLGEGWEKVEHEDLEKLQEKDQLDESYTALDQALKDNQELQRKQAEALKRVAELEKRNKELRVNLAKKEAEVTHLRSYGPASTLSTDSERYYTPYSGLSENGSKHRGLFQVATDSDILLKLQNDNVAKDGTIKNLEGEVNQLKKRLKYAEQLEEQNIRLTTEESKHEEEKQMLRREVESLKHKASVCRPPTQSYAHEQKLQELAQCYEQQYHEELEENSRLREKISQLEKEIQGQEERSTHINEVGDPEDRECKDDTIKRLEGEVNQLKKRLKYAEQLEEQNIRLTTEESKHEEEKQMLRREVDLLKRKASVSRPLTRSYAHEQKLQELAQRYEQQYHDELDENSRLREKISQLEKEIQGQEEGIAHIDEVDDLDLNAGLRRKDQHVHTLEAQVQALQQHSKGQSKNILQLKQELEAVKVLEPFEAETLQLEARIVTSDRAQKNELAKLRVKVKEAETVTEQLDRAIEHVTDLETENQVLKQQVAKLQEQTVGEAAAQQSGGEITYQSYNREVMAELNRLQLFEAEVQRLQKELTEAEGFHAAAIKFESQVLPLITQVSEKEKEISDLRTEKSQLEARILALGNRDAKGEIIRPREQLLAKEEELKQLKSEMVDKTGGRKTAGYDEEAYAHLKRQLELKEKENLNLKSKFAALALPEKPTPKPRTRDAATDQAADQPPPLDSPTDVVELQKILEEKEAQIAHMRQQLEKMATDLTKLVHHAKGQSQIVKELRQQLGRAEEEQSQLRMEKDNLTVAKDSIQDEIERLQKSCTGKETALIATQHENGRLKRHLDHLNGEMNQLKEEIDWLKREKGQLEGRNSQLDSHLRRLQEEAVALRLQLASQKSEQDQLHRQLDETEATVRQLEADLNFSRARVAELVGESTKMKTALSEAEHDHQRIYQELSKLMTEKEAAQAEQLQLRQLTQEKDQFLQSLQSEKDQLRQQLSALSWQIQRYAQQPQSQCPHESNFWEVPRNEITLDNKILGIGAWGYVVEGIFRSQKVAVKCLHDMIRQPKVIELIRKEISIMAQIRHPNMVMLIAAVIDGENDPLIITELLDISLRKAYEKHLLQGSSKLSIFRDVASALNYLHLHQQGEIIHRDVSSANVLLEAKPNNQWKAKLSDFGSAKLAIEAKTTGPGAPAYTAPEVQREMGICQTAKLDVYSYGILLCEVIVEQFPMDGSLPSMMGTVQNRWPFMHGLVTSCMQEHPDNRPTMSYVLGEFDKL